jgi:hypothetical protein
MTASASVRTDTVVTLTAPAIPVVNLPRIAADVAGLREYGRWFVSTWPLWIAQSYWEIISRVAM